MKIMSYKAEKSTLLKTKVISPRAKLPGTEKKVETAILIYLSQLKDCFAWKNNSTGVYDPVKKVFRKPLNKFLINGVADIIAVYKGRALFVEVKSPGKEKNVSEHQKLFLQNAKEAGAMVLVASSVEMVKEFLDAVTP